MILGVVLLIAGVIIISVLLVFPQAETMNRIEVDVTTRSSYLSPPFDALNEYWLNLNIHSTDNCTLHVRSDDLGDIFQISGTTFDDEIQIPTRDMYRVEVANDDKGHYNPLQGWIDPIEISITGSFFLQRKPLYYDLLLSFGAIMLAGGLLIYMRTDYKAHARVEK